ncbi:MAG: AI-2E family transporter [Bacteroides sp.]|nr:AI-2E family transporter [Eubacterium sp.]MCM1419486.1 AI-2E family transporter [Roseburia sp.]MCM1463349.1 AI-2E family transporter [Bacteroides sp.]
MKFRWNKRYLGWGLTAFAVIFASTLVIFILMNQHSLAAGIGGFLNALVPIFYGFILAYLLCPIVNFFETRVFGRLFAKKKAPDRAEAKAHGLNIFVKNKLARVFSILVTLVIVIAIIVGVISAIIPQLESTIRILVNNIPSYIATLTDWITSAFASFPDLGAEVTDMVNQSFVALRDFLSNSILPQVGDYLGSLTNGIVSLIGILMNLVLGLVISIYCLYSKELFSAQAKKALYSILKVKHANTFIGAVRRIHRSFGSFITGTLIDSFVVACVTFIVTTLFNIPFALLVSVLMGLTNIIPYFGPFIGAIPSAFLILMEDPLKSLIFIAIVLVIQNLNGNVLSPRILGENIGLSSFWVIFALLAGQGIFGFWGLIIGIPLFAVIYSTIRALVAARLEAKGLPAGSDIYTDIKCFEEETLTPVSLSREGKDEREKEKRPERGTPRRVHKSKTQKSTTERSGHDDES